MVEQRHIFVNGRVQGVAYRYFACQVARRLGLKGQVRNLRDGRVEARAEGDAAALDQWLEELRVGPPHAQVTGIDQEVRAATGEFTGFDIVG